MALWTYGVKDVDFETNWNQGHTQAEDSGEGTDNFIEWVEECCASSPTGINTITSAAVTDSNIYYDLSGRKVSNPTRGIYIHNGKKVIIK